MEKFSRDKRGVTKMDAIQRLSHQIAKEKGFWGRCWDCDGSPAMSRKKDCGACSSKSPFSIIERNDGELISLMHSELSEALEWLRNATLSKDEQIQNVAEEMADLVIRVCDFCEARGINLNHAIWEKLDKNKKRPHKHGKRF